MKHYKEVVETVTKHDITTCDICGENIYAETEKSHMPIIVRDVTISYEHGESWPDDASIYNFDPDICPKCFREKIYPFILSLLKPDSLTWSDDWHKDKHDCMPEILKE